jgi:hypothetical protein
MDVQCNACRPVELTGLLGGGPRMRMGRWFLVEGMFERGIRTRRMEDWRVYAVLISEDNGYRIAEPE